MGFHSLQHIRSRRSTCRGLCLPATFRLQGLVTLLTAYSLRFRAGSVSHRRRSWDYPFGAFFSRKVSPCYHADAPTCRFSRSSARRLAPTGRALRAAAPGLSPFRESLANRRAFNTAAAGCSHGLRPSRACSTDLGPGSRPNLLSRAWSVAFRRRRPAPQSIDQSAPRTTPRPVASYRRRAIQPL
jgi:hypothetical protein